MKILKFYKPFEVLSKFTDREGRSNLSDFITVKSVYPVGRLDYRSEGLLILTDDGQINNYLTSPSNKQTKVYLVQVEGNISDKAVNQLNNQIVIPIIQTRLAENVERIQPPNIPDRSKLVRNYHPTSWIRISVTEGKKHQIRRMTAAVGYPTLRLVRIQIGPIDLNGLKPGEWRHLNSFELESLAVNR